MTNLDQEAKTLAKKWLTESESYKTISDKIYTKKMDKFFLNSKDKEFVIKILDKAFRPKHTKDISYIIGNIPPLKFLNPFENILRILFNLSRNYFHFIAIPALKQFIYFSASKYILFGNDGTHKKIINKNLKNKIRTNLNRIGELLLGESEATKRIEQYIKDLKNPDISCISIKISTIYSQISSIAFDQTVETISNRLSIIYRAAKENKYNCPITNETSYKLVNLDMEEYKDLAITVEAFIKTLSKDEFKDLKAGIALQAYLPDSYIYLQKITNWAKERTSQGGSPIRVRIVKGANMEMELFESYERNWNLAPFSTKVETDANWKNMLEYSLNPENIKAVNVGVASHNLFDIAYIYLIAKENNVLDQITFEMLSGMSEHISKMLAQDFNLNILLYLPVSNRADFLSSIGYLIRRLDENTSTQNYLRYINGLAYNNKNLEIIEDQFSKSLEIKDSLKNIKTNRKQNRLTENPLNTLSESYESEADTDFSIPANIDFTKQIIQKWQNISNLKIPAVIEGREIFIEENSIAMTDHNNISRLVGRYYNSGKKDAGNALIAAKESISWKNLSETQRLKIISEVIVNIKKRRGDIIGAIALETSKTFIESDAEVSEAIDFGRYYSCNFLEMKKELNNSVKYQAKGTVLIISPWNFPFAIPAGGIFAALITGNNVIFKPSNLSIFIGYELAKCFWDAGVPKDALQFIPSVNSTAGVELSKSELVDFIVFTGGTSTALSIIKSNPKVKIAAETGGKNFTIATKFSDRDQVIKNIIQSAFSSAGQKCSATSVLALETELYDDQKFLENLADAVKSLTVDYAWNLKTKINPLIRKPVSDLEYGLTTLEDDEKWIVEPKILNREQTLWSPGIRIGTKPGNKSHTTEFFGPTLAIMKINNLEDGITLANLTGYGLTSALESLNEDEQIIWKNKIKAGNLYINRPTTGAIVCRQPFGGMNRSAFGTGIKAGGVNYIYQFLQFENINLDNKTPNYLEIFTKYFSKEIDYADIPGQSNITRFLKTDNIAIRATESSNIDDIKAIIIAAKLCVTNVYLSLESEKILELLKSSNEKISQYVKIEIESKEKFINKASNFKRIRIIPSNEDHSEIYNAAAKTGITIIADPIIYNGRIELLNYLQEQSISNNYHRFGHAVSLKN